MNRKVLKSLDDVVNWFIFPYPIIACDTETTNLDYLTQELVGISFCSGMHSCYIDIIDNPEKDNILIFLRNYFENDVKFLIGQNISYDLKVLQRFGVITQEINTKFKIFDTMTASHLLDENSPKNLNFLTEKYLNRVLKNWEDVKEDYHSQKFYDYGTDDAEAAYDLYKIFHPLLKLENLDNLFFDIEMNFQRVLVDLEINGILICQEKLAELQRELIKILYDLKIKMCEAGNIEYWTDTNLLGEKISIMDINFNSSQQLVKLITEKLGLEITEKTDAGNLSVGESSLRKIKAGLERELLNAKK